MQAAALGMNNSGKVRLGRLPNMSQKFSVRTERSEGILEVRVNGREEPIFQESTWNEDEEAMPSIHE